MSDEEYIEIVMPPSRGPVDNAFSQTLDIVHQQMLRSMMLPPEALNTPEPNRLPDRPFRYVIDKDMRVIATIGPVPPEVSKASPPEVLKQVWAVLAAEAYRQAHREQYHGQPAVECPRDGLVAALEENIDARVKHHTVKCPLCGDEIYVGRFKAVLLLAQHRRRAMAQAPSVYLDESKGRLTYES